MDSSRDAWSDHLDREVCSDGLEATVEDGDEMTEADLDEFDPANPGGSPRKGRPL